MRITAGDLIIVSNLCGMHFQDQRRLNWYREHPVCRLGMNFPPAPIGKTKIGISSEVLSLRSLGYSKNLELAPVNRPNLI